MKLQLFERQRINNSFLFCNLTLLLHQTFQQHGAGLCAHTPNTTVTFGEEFVKLPQGEKVKREERERNKKINQKLESFTVHFWCHI